jgi:glycosyltransferase involved in cell wall biosynthesis
MAPVPGSRTSVVFLTTEPLVERPPGPAHRTLRLAEAVARHCRVTVAAPRGSVFPEGPFETIETGPRGDTDLPAALAGHDVAVVQNLPSPRQLLAVRRHVPHLVVDMIAPLAFEAAEIASNDAARRAVTRWRMNEQVAHLMLADLVLCTNERQRDLALGAGLTAAALRRGRGLHALAERIAVVPHGVDPEGPRSGRSPLRESGAIGERDRVAIWAGGMWSWLDPLTAVKAVERLRPNRPDLRLALVGYEHPDPGHRAAHEPVTAEALDYVRERGLDGVVVLTPGWLTREEYFDHLHDADVGLSLHRPTLEGRFAARTRVLDYLSAGLPVVCTAGDTMSDLVAKHGLGSAVDAFDVAGCAEAIDRLTAGERGRIAAGDVLEQFLWPNVSRPLVEFCVDPGAPRGLSAWRAAAITARQYPAFLSALYRSGPGEVTRAAARGARRAIRRR